MTWYLQLNLAVGIFGLLAISISHLNINAQQKLKIHSVLIIFSILTLPTMQLIPEESYQYLQREFTQAPIGLTNQSVQAVNEVLATSPASTVHKVEYASYFVLLFIFLTTLLLILRTIKTVKVIHQTFLHKQVGDLKILISDKNVSPYSFSLLQKSYVVLPQFLLNDMKLFKMALQHELQHLRNNDTLWVYIFELTSTVCFLNPILYFWRKQFLLDQEFACDEALIAQKKVSPRAYATCLLQVAEITTPHTIPFGTTGMVWEKTKPQLLRRIIRMKQIKKETKVIFNSLLVVSVFFFTATVFALHSPMDRLTLSELEKIADPSDFNDFPIEINDNVLAELNRFLSNSKWKKFTQESLKRYENYKTLIDQKANQYHLPTEIAAIAFIESGFVNLPDRSTSISSKGAGVWQFIPKTARNYGLKVNLNTDERLHIPKATEAAMKYLSSNKHKLEDLRLAIMGYYVGEGRVQQDIDNFGTRNPWVLIEKGNYKTPYLARAMAAAILLKYPALLE